MLIMKRQFKKMAASLIVAGLVVSGVSTGVVFAASADLGSSVAVSVSNDSVKEMLLIAIEDELMAQAEYKVILDTFDLQRPISNLLKAKENHINLLTTLLKEYDVAIPNKDYASLVTVSASVEAAIEVGISNEKNNIAMYENFLKKDLPKNVKDVFTALLNASKKHLAAFERQKDGTCTGDGTGFQNGNGNRAGKQAGCNGTGTGNDNGNGRRGNGGKGNRGASQGSCIVS